MISHYLVSQIKTLVITGVLLGCDEIWVDLGPKQPLSPSVDIVLVERCIRCVCRSSCGDGVSCTVAVPSMHTFHQVGLEVDVVG